MNLSVQLSFPFKSFLLEVKSLRETFYLRRDEKFRNERSILVCIRIDEERRGTFLMSRVSGTSFQLLFDAVNRGESKCRVQANVERRKRRVVHCCFWLSLTPILRCSSLYESTFHVPAKTALLVSVGETSPSSFSSPSSSFSSVINSTLDFS